MGDQSKLMRYTLHVDGIHADDNGVWVRYEEAREEVVAVAVKAAAETREYFESALAAAQGKLTAYKANSAMRATALKEAIAIAERERDEAREKLQEANREMGLLGAEIAGLRSRVKSAKASR